MWIRGREGVYIVSGGACRKFFLLRTSGLFWFVGTLAWLELHQEDTQVASYWILRPRLERGIFPELYT